MKMLRGFYLNGFEEYGLLTQSEVTEALKWALFCDESEPKRLEYG